MPDIFSKEKRSEVMSLIRSKGTRIERKFRMKLYKNGIRGYKVNPKMYSNPDFVFKEQKVIIFCDGDFWHGRNYEKLKPKLKNEFWVNKIERNMVRDVKYTKELRKRGWIVLRFWESEINKDIIKCINEVKKVLKKRGYKP